jgi:pyridinium-3,5-biscarboxylic acid mononucleotide sulfurtransferase
LKSDNEKYGRLLGILKELDSVLLAFSGGVDSSFLLKALKDSGIKALAVTASSETMPAGDLKNARELAELIGVTFRAIVTCELDNPDFAQNPRDRCFYCKDELFSNLSGIADAEGYAVIIDGNNTDDLADWRPGRKAALAHGVRSPLIEAGFTKDEIRKLSKELGLPTWSKPASPCLASRFPYGMPITKEALRRVDEAESFLNSLGFVELRVRSHPGDIARIEAPKAEIPRILENENMGRISERFRELGFKYITVDLDGFRSGNLNG